MYTSKTFANVVTFGSILRSDCSKNVIPRPCLLTDGLCLQKDGAAPATVNQKRDKSEGQQAAAAAPKKSKQPTLDFFFKDPKKK